tara:strand:- start:6699 stop:7514 length:816 start_codon:yes stop_codon:yes gene_type:complete
MTDSTDTTQVHASAIVGDEVELGQGVEIGPFCIVQGRVKLSDGVRLLSSVSIQGPVEIGANTIVYPNATIGYEPQDYKFAPGSPTAGVIIGENTILREGATVHAASNNDTPTQIGDRVMMMVASHAGHDTVVGNDVILVNSTHLGGFAKVEDRVILAGGSLVHQFCRVGRQAMSSGAAVLTGDLPPFCMAAGRNKIVGLNLVGMRRSGMSADEINAVRHAYKTVLRKNPPMPIMKQMLAELGQQSPAVKLISDFINDAQRPIIPVGGRRVS